MTIAADMKNTTRLSAFQRFRYKFFTAKFLKSCIWKLIRFILLVELSFIIIFPFLVKLFSSFMSQTDILDKTVKYVPKSPTLDNFSFVIEYTQYYSTLINTLIVSLVGAVCSIAVAVLVGYGLAKFKFKGNKIVFLFVLVCMIIPPQTVMMSMFAKFRYFDVLGLVKLFSGDSANLIDTMYPLILTTMTGFGIKGGLYILIMRQFFRGVPDELSEAAYVDGSGVFRTFFNIILPLATPMILTIFLFSFAWQWTDTYYSGIFFSGYKVLANTIFTVTFVPQSNIMAGTTYSSIMLNTATLLAIIPLILLFVFAQKWMVQGIERSGLVG